jgi:hypothetical protein
MRHFPATAALPCAACQNVAVSNEKQTVKPHSTIIRQMLSLKAPTAKMNERTAIARR